MEGERGDLVVRVELPGLPPTLNRVRNLHWRARHGEMRKWREHTALAVRAKLGPEVPRLQEARVVMTRCSAKEPDYDNLVGSGKPIIDGLCAKHGCGLIEDDAPQHLRVEYRWEKASPRAGKVVVEVWRNAT